MDESAEFRFLDALVGIEIRVFLANTKALVGTLKEHDETVLIMSRPGKADSMIYKDHITTIIIHGDGE